MCVCVCLCVCVCVCVCVYMYIYTTCDDDKFTPTKHLLYPAGGASLGIRGMWINCSHPELPDDEHVLPLEDDIEVSPLYYWWLLRAARTYGPLGDGALVRQRRLLGISLYTPRLNEIRYPQAK